MSNAVHEVPSFKVVSGKQVFEVVDGRENDLIKRVEQAYISHHKKMTVNPDSYFLKFPERPANRIIALPAHIEGEDGDSITGIKWISSFPGNVKNGLPRASAILILNNSESGYPEACLEASIISATRTAASAASMVKLYNSKNNKKSYKLGVVGAGLINRYVLKFIMSSGVDLVGVRIFDLNEEFSERTVKRLREIGMQDVEVAQSMAEAIKYGEIISFATTAPTPHVLDPKLFAHAPLVLHLSLRDLGPEVILSSTNVVDDIDHALKAQTSLHLTEIKMANRDFVSSTIAELLLEEKSLPMSQTVVYSPFGMGILDLAIGKFVVDEVKSNAVSVDDFFHDLVRI